VVLFLIGSPETHPYMKTIITLIILFVCSLSMQQAKAQSSGKSYQEWLEENTGRKTAARTPAAPKAKPAANNVEPEDKPVPVLAAPAGTFKGTLACSDCQGINTELTLSSGPNGANRTFTMKQTYMGRPADKSVVNSSGKWFPAKGNKQDPDAVILQLIPTAGNIDPMYFLQVSDTEVKLLDRTQNEIKSHSNNSLKKQ
jgi:uncharacterized lipoprotein NlpE involved in copper resistance